MRPAGRLAPTADDPDFGLLKARIIARTGHHYYEDKDHQLWERVAQRMGVLGVERVADYAARLDRDHGEWQALESAITINETFFFRFSEQFDALRRSILPALIARNLGEKRLRIWSVGCSTGAEPYSVAILVHELLGSALDGWRVTITGTDIDEQALAMAREGLFGRWALRAMEPAARRRYFTEADDRFRLNAAYRGMVRFERHNLMSLLDPAAALQFTGYDLILCRNVLIYFRHDVAAALVASLVERLHAEGWLLIGHAEPSPEIEAKAASTPVDGVIAFRPRGTTAPAAKPVEPAPEERPARKTARPAPRRRTATAQPRAEVPAADRLAEIRAALGRGALEEAGALCGTSLANDPGQPVVQYLAGLAAAAGGDAARAEAALRRAVYLDQDFAMAHYLLGQQLCAAGRATEGRRALTNAGRIAARLEPSAPVAEGDGMTAGELTEAVRGRVRGAAR